MQIETLSTTFQKARPAANSTDSSFTAKPPTKVEPTGDGVVNVGFGGATAPNGIVILPYALGSNNDTFDVRVLGWRRICGTNQQVDLWVAHILAEWQCVISSTAKGVVGTPVIDTEFFADTMTLATNMGTANVSVETVSPQNDTPAHAVLDVKGVEKIEVLFDKTGTPPTSMNCLIAKI